MRRLIFLIIFMGLFPILVNTTAIVNNSGTTSEDSITVFINLTDSLGNPQSIADSFLVAVFKSGTNAVVFADSGDASMTGLDSVRFTNFGGFTQYYYHRAVADIDGAGDPGTYMGIIVAMDNDDGTMIDRTTFQFQIVSQDFDATYLAKLQIIEDSVDALLDTIQLWDTRIDSMEAALADVNIGDKVWTDGTHVNRSFLIDSMQAVIDSLQSQDDWVSILDSAIISRIIGRKVYGIPAGSGSDSTALADRKIRVEQMLNNIITASIIAGDAIQAQEINGNAWAELLDSLFLRLVSDTNAGTYMAQVLRENRQSLDSLQSQDDWIAKNSADSVWDRSFNSSFATGSMGDSLNNATYV